LPAKYTKHCNLYNVIQETLVIDRVNTEIARLNNAKLDIERQIRMQWRRRDLARGRHKATQK